MHSIQRHAIALSTFLTIAGLIATPSSAADCRYVVKLSSFDLKTNARFKGHVGIHVFGFDAPGGYGTYDPKIKADSKTMYLSEGDFYSVLDAYRNLKERDIKGNNNCRAGAEEKDTQTNYLLARQMRGQDKKMPKLAKCTHWIGAHNQKCQTISNPVAARSFKYIYMFVEGQWILQNSYPMDDVPSLSDSSEASASGTGRKRSRPDDGSDAGNSPKKKPRKGK